MQYIPNSQRLMTFPLISGQFRIELEERVNMARASGSRPSCLLASTAIAVALASWGRLRPPALPLTARHWRARWLGWRNRDTRQGLMRLGRLVVTGAFVC